MTTRIHLDNLNIVHAGDQRDRCLRDTAGIADFLTFGVLVLLIGLSAKTSILIVEFAKQLRAEGKSIAQAAAEAAQLRFRAILMTAFSFILGVFPLVIASGAGAASRRSLGTAVFGGMLASVVFGVFLTPVLYVVVQGVSEKIRGTARAATGKVTSEIGGAVSPGAG